MFEHKKIIISVLILMCAYLVDYFILHKEENTVLETKFGKLKGKVELSRDGRQFYAFLGNVTFTMFNKHFPEFVMSFIIRCSIF
jgi:hypothetical protein